MKNLKERALPEHQHQRRSRLLRIGSIESLSGRPLRPRASGAAMDARNLGSSDQRGANQSESAVKAALTPNTTQRKENINEIQRQNSGLGCRPGNRVLICQCITRPGTTM